MIDIVTNGEGVVQTWGRMWRHFSLGHEMAAISLEIGDESIDINFSSWDEMIDFCEKHNFTYNDKRSGVDKYIAAQRRNEEQAS